MIFASIGSQLPFDRFVRALDEWAARNPSTPVFIQIGEGAYEPQHAQWARMLPNPVYQAKLAACSVFAAHVGMGSILTALELQRPAVLMPRLASLKEHTTDHQLHTANKFRDRRGIFIVDGPEALKMEISNQLANPPLPGDALASTAPEPLLGRVANYLKTGRA